MEARVSTVRTTATYATTSTVIRVDFPPEYPGVASPALDGTRCCARFALLGESAGNLLSLRGLGERAEIGHRAFRTPGRARRAEGPPVKYKNMGKQGPVVLPPDLHQVPLDFF